MSAIDWEKSLAAAKARAAELDRPLLTYLFAPS